MDLQTSEHQELGQLSNMLGAMDPLNEENDFFASGLHNEEELLYEPESSIIDHTMIDDGEYLI